MHHASFLPRVLALVVLWVFPFLDFPVYGNPRMEKTTGNWGINPARNPAPFLPSRSCDYCIPNLFLPFWGNSIFLFTMPQGFSVTKTCLQAARRFIGDKCLGVCFGIFFPPKKKMKRAWWTTFPGAAPACERFSWVEASSWCREYVNMVDEEWQRCSAQRK